MTKTIVVLLMALTLSGCSMLRKTPAIAVEVEEVNMPVAVSCIKTKPAKPAYPLDDPAVKALPLYDRVMLALKEIELRRGYEAQLEAVIKACE